MDWGYQPLRQDSVFSGHLCMWVTYQVPGADTGEASCQQSSQPEGFRPEEGEKMGQHNPTQQLRQPHLAWESLLVQVLPLAPSDCALAFPFTLPHSILCAGWELGD